ncbi:MAG: MBL fold metallo-hydrolase, partial [Microbacterium sp.]
MRVTRIGGPSVLVELDGWRILIDPTFDPPGRRYPFALGTSSVKTRGPAIEPSSLGEIDLILVSHDHHADNLDTAGRALLPTATHVLTTASGARRLALPNVHGLTAGQKLELEVTGRARLEVTATPCRHGPAFSHPIVGDVIGFAFRRPGQRKVLL